ncbi:hypothetical protein E2C01_059926 [Portunus trituberculatus]|uniref:Uncharacterized protein n=1 Tax=Portunus trituberculatus TaxID=210409 RepID=A0A5B7H0V0_PORTR|nr:hypothetical protein [Portunus trituberculatus]
MPSKDNSSSHKIACTLLHTLPSLKTKKRMGPRSVCSLDSEPKCLDTSLNFSSLTFATFGVLNLIFNL